MQSRVRASSSGTPRQSGTACGEQTARSRHLASSGFPAHLGANLSRLTPRQSASSHNLYVTNTIINAALTPSPGHMSLVARTGHDSERAAIIYQHEARGADPTVTKRDRRSLAKPPGLAVAAPGISHRTRLAPARRRTR